MNEHDYDYLIFRRIVIFLDEWLSYLLLVYLYYHQRENNKLLLGFILTLVWVFNLVGYYYLGLLEEKYSIYESTKCWII